MENNNDITNGLASFIYFELCPEDYLGNIIEISHAIYAELMGFETINEGIL